MKKLHRALLSILLLAMHGFAVAVLPLHVNSTEFDGTCKPKVVYELDVPAASKSIPASTFVQRLQKKFTVEIAPIFLIHKCFKRKGICLTEVHRPISIVRDEGTFEGIPKAALKSGEIEQIACTLDMQRGERVLGLIHPQRGLYRMISDPLDKIFKPVVSPDFNDGRGHNYIEQVFQKNKIRIKDFSHAGHGVIASTEIPLHESDWARGQVMGNIAAVPVLVDEEVSYQEIEEAINQARRELQK